MRFAMMNAFNASNAAAAASNAPVVPKSASKPTQEPAAKKKKEDPLKDKYRDRAEERRQRGEEVEEQEVENMDADALRERRERSKYLGGSEETTHLVEGLDILLYERRKIEIELEEKKKAEAAARAAEPMLVGAKQLIIDRHGHAKAVDAPKEFKTERGKGVYDALFRREARPNVESFLPGRKTYVFPLIIDSPQELPTIIERNMLSDTDALSERDIRFEPFLASTSDNALKKLSVVMSYLNQGEAGLKKRRSELRERELNAKRVITETINRLAGDKQKVDSASKADKMEIEEDDEDIFGDVAATEYTPTVKGEKKSKETEIPKSAEQSMWDKVRAADSDGRQKGDTSAKRARDEANRRDAESAMQVEDDYDGFLSGSEEEDIFAMDTGVRLKRGDFETEAEWEKYASTREAIPKSAFQFGVKASDGKRKDSRRKSDKVRLYHALYKSVPGTSGSKSRLSSENAHEES